MQKSRSYHPTYTIQGYQSIYRQNQIQNPFDQTGGNANSMMNFYDSENIAKSQLPIDNGDLSGLNTSGDNSTIYECVQMLETTDHSQVEESKNDSTRRFSSLDLRACQENHGNFLTAQDLQTRTSKPDLSEVVREYKEGVQRKSKKEGITRPDDDKENAKAVPALKYQVVMTKNSSKNSISKISGSMFNSTKASSTSISASVTARRRRREPSVASKDSQSITQGSRFVTSPLYTDRDFVQSPRSNRAPIKQQQVNQVTSPKSKGRKEFSKQQQTTTTEGPSVSASYQVSLWRRDSVPQKQAPQSPKNSLQLPVKPLAISLSRNVQVLATPRGDYISPRNNTEKERGVESTKKVERKQSGKKEPVDNSSKNKKEQGPKSTRIDLIELDLTTKPSQKKKEEKMEDHIDQLDKIYESLRRSLLEKKDEVMQNEKGLQIIGDLKGFMQSTQTVVKGLKNK